MATHWYKYTENGLETHWYKYMENGLENKLLKTYI